VAIARAGRAAGDAALDVAGRLANKPIPALRAAVTRRDTFIAGSVDIDL
jgi:hypothetical protein